jgi:hypothetical protein
MKIYHMINRKGYCDLVDSVVVIADTVESAYDLIRSEGYSTTHLTDCSVIGESTDDQCRIVTISRKVG